jgi:hypothetical protein
MEKIRAIYFNSLRNEAHFEFLTRFKGLLDATPPVKDLVITYLPAFEERLTKEGELLNAMRKSDFTAQIADADQRVDRCLTGMNAAITSALHHFDPNVVEAAQSLYNRFHAFGEIAAKSYEEETAAVTLLISDLNGPEYFPKAVLVGLPPWLTELTAAEAAFEQLFAQRLKETADKPQGRLTDARRDVEVIYRPMTETINAATYMSVTPPATGAFIAELNAIITYFNDHTHRRARKDLGEGDHTVVAPIDTQAYTEKPVTVVPKVYYREDDKPTVELSLGKDFAVTYKNNTNVGTAELTIHGKGAYKGQKTVTFNIARAV